MAKLREFSMRRAVSGDLDAVARIWHESASAMDGAAVQMPSAEALRQRIDTELRSGWTLYVAVRREHVVGMLALKPAVAILDQIFVAPAEQGKGVGRDLLGLAKRMMAAGFTLRMDAANERAKRFYETEGMTKVAEGVHPSTGIPVHYYGWNLR